MTERNRDEPIAPPARIELFGFRSTPAEVRVIPRSSAWRLGRAFGYLLLCWLAIPAVMWVPPHVPWVLAAFSFGIFYFVKYARQRYTLVELRGTCPKCGAPFTLSRAVRLGRPHRLVCPQCRQTPLLRTELEARSPRADAA